MRVFDRFYGTMLALPSTVESGRYRIEQAVVLNGKVPVDAGCLLFSDGGQVVRLDCNFMGEFEKPFYNEVEQVECDLRQRAIELIVAQMQSVPPPAKMPSPLLPAALAEAASLLALESTLAEILARGHLQEIARRPRMNLRYEARLTPLSRAKKLAPMAETQLASRSADWQKRTISGVIPKRIFALFSEDDFLLYENKVFARLLDNLAIYLRRRVQEVGQLQQQYERALKMADAQDLYHVLRTELCNLWGQACSGSDKSESDRLEDSQKVYAKLNSLLSRIDILRQTGLYKEIPHSAQVPAQIKSTNILCHDQHYRHLRSLWLAHQATQIGGSKPPHEVYAWEAQAHRNYVEYVGLIIRRVLDNMPPVDFNEDGTYGFAGQLLHLKREDDCWRLHYDKQQLVLIPALHVIGNFVKKHSSSEVRIAVYCHGEEVPESVDQYLDAKTPSPPLFINPMGFYGQERMHTLIDIWLWRPLFVDYAKPVEKIPSNLLNWLSRQGLSRINGQDAIFLKPLDASDKASTFKYLETAQINDQTRRRIEMRIRHLSALNVCRACGCTSNFLPTGDADFKASCTDCGTEWGLWHESKIRKARYSLIANHQVGQEFASHGRWSVEMIL